MERMAARAYLEVSVSMTIRWSGIQCVSTGAVVNASLSAVKDACALLVLSKLECDTFAGEVGERDDNVRVVEDEVTIKISEAKEGLNILYFLRLGPILNYLNFRLVHGESLGRQNVPKVLYLLRVKLTFVGMGKKPVLAKASEHFFDVFAMICGIVRINEDVV